MSVAFNHDGWLIGWWEVRPADPGLGLRLDGVTILDDLRWLGDERPRLAPEGRFEHLFHRVDQDELHRLADLVGDVPQVLLVLPRDDHGLRARQVSGKDLALEPTDRQHPATQRDLTGHR